MTLRAATVGALGQLCLEMAPLLASAASQFPPADETLVARSSLCVTEGSLEEAGGAQISVNVPKMRAVVNRRTADAVELRFTYLGPTATQVPLASGASRQQLGLKVRAADPCNLLYVMWRLQPSAELVVSLKSNAGQHSSAECGNHGYHDIPPTVRSPILQLKPGDSQRLRAEIAADELHVLVDDQLVWHGHLPPEVARLEGPVGLRTDNVRLMFQLGIARAPTGNAPPVSSCPQEPD